MRKIAHSPEAYERISSIARGSADSRPRTVFTVTGKKVRYAEMTETRSQSVGVQPAIERLPRPTTTIGAIARIGIVCEPTTYGIRPRWSIWYRAITAPSVKPTIVPIAKPTSASLAVKSAALKSNVINSSPSSWTGSNRAPTIDGSEGNVMSSTANGHVHPVARKSSR